MAHQRILLAFAGTAALAACVSSAVTPDATNPEMPPTWVRDSMAEAVETNWLQVLRDEQLTAFVREAIENNYQLKQQRARLAEAEQAVVVARAGRLPSLDLSIDGRRTGLEEADGTSVNSTSFDASLDAQWTVDIWGRLSKEQQSVQLAYQAQQARLAGAERALAANTATTLFSVMQAKQLLEVAGRRLENAILSRDIVDSGYRQGLNDALDLYLAKNQVERQQANFSQQQQAVVEVTAELQLALAQYPDGNMQVTGELPVLTDRIATGLPSELILRRADLQEAWLNLLASDASLAAAHKARFPRLALVGSTGVSSLEFSDLLDGEASAWSLLGGITQPLFQGGRLAAQERQAAERVAQAEQQYLDLVYRAFAEVENAISRAESLQDRYEAFLDAEANSTSALILALEQYQRGLVPYTTVLESQRQAYDAVTTVVQLKNQLLQNRINLYLSLGGEFETEY
jgi:multidrug efflux system outer membrane protein